jgi:outer membrane receptor for ferrienterochelin and colicin
MTVDNVLDEVQVSGRRMSTSIAYLEPIKVQKITTKELMKAACCNLSESFETNPSVDVSFTDAVTGTRRIEMLGLSGPYVQITRELIPDIRGLAALTGFTYVPGPWVSGIQLSQGVGSVLSGFESVAGQINVGLKKSFDPEKLFVNGYLSNGGRYEGNVIGNTKLNKNWYTNGMLHYALNAGHNDRNKDGFLDMPTGKAFIADNTWKMDKPDTGNEAEFGIKITNTTQESGQDHGTLNHNSGEIWTAGNDVQRYEAWMKRGKVFLDAPYKSIGIQIGATHHNTDQYYGKTSYSGTQNTLYANALFQTIIKDSDNKIVMGSSVLIDHVDERVFGKSYQRREYIPGIFTEMTNRLAEGFTTIVGLRADHHNNFGLFFTPRIHARYEITHDDVIRVSAGRGQRTASIFAENLGSFASSRKWNIEGQNNANPYGLNPEAAWTFGISYVKIWTLDKMDVTWGTDAYHINFINQVVTDLDNSPREVLFYNLDGVSRSNTFQTQLDFNLANGLDIRAAYRYVNVETDYKSGRLEKAFVSPHRTFLNIAYETKSGWNFDYTFNYQSSRRLPNTRSNPEGLRLDERSPAFTMSIAQIAKKFKGNDIYLGVENLFDFRQDDPILDPTNPNGQFFDASMTWGPIFGRMIYAGFRYTLK